MQPEEKAKANGVITDRPKNEEIVPILPRIRHSNLIDLLLLFNLKKKCLVDKVRFLNQTYFYHLWYGYVR